MRDSGPQESNISMPHFATLARTILWSLFTAICGAVLILSSVYLFLNPSIPTAESIRQVTLRAPLRIYSSDFKLIQEYGERLTPIAYNDIPTLFINALLDTEDKRFFEHSGIDLITLANATYQLIINRGEIKTGASTITMQLVKNISGETQLRFIRKFKEMLLALKIENELSKQEILTLYLNVIPFGKHAFGIQAAANVYYGKDVDRLNLAQLAMLAGIPKAPEKSNPVNGPKRALDRRNLVLQRMLEQSSIHQQAYDEAVKSPITASVHGRVIELSALYVAEMVRKHLLTEYGEQSYDAGFVVYTTLDGDKQLLGKQALEKKLNEYDRRHGYRKPERHQIQGTDQFLAAPEYGYPANWITTLENTLIVGNQHPAIVTSVSDTEVRVLMKKDREVAIPMGAMTWAKPYLTVDTRGPAPGTPSDVVSVGDLIRVAQDDNGGWELGQVPEIQGALVALDPNNGAILALVGGYDFSAKQFNHVTQARRQPGSIFKPFFYTGALANGLTPASIFNDAPMVLPGGELEEVYRPRNVGGFRGKVRLREALYRSINLVSMRIIMDFGAQNAIDYVSRFGFDTQLFPRNTQLAVGGGTIALTPLEIATGYAAFANGGFKVNPYIIERIETIEHEILFEARAETVCSQDCVLPQPNRIIEQRVAYIMQSMLNDVIKKGTARKAYRALKRDDLGGKTGTTNDADIWFSGFNRSLVATTWAGFSNNSPVGNREWGSTTPIETWIEFMQAALPEQESPRPPQPAGIVAVRIDATTGLRARSSDPNTLFELFREENVPPLGPKLDRKTDEEENSTQLVF